MRIISGYLKGRKIDQPKDKTTRPLKDLTKESIFNILLHSNLFNFKIDKMKILDLFSGVGSFGLECISRGAENVIFCEKYPETLKILKRNIVKFECEKKTKILENDIFDIKKIREIYKKKFEIIFLDPPFKEKKVSSLLDDIISLKLLSNNGIIIIHRHKKEKEIFPESFKIVKTETYGVSKIIFGS